MNRSDIINTLAKICDAKKYLEIGTASGGNFPRVNIGYKIGVDPNPRSSNATHRMTSDVFFRHNHMYYDIIFIDGLHHAVQVAKDIDHALDCLTPGGFIVCHDMIPKSKEQQMVPRIQATWTGDCWKAWVAARQIYELKMFVVDTDCGCGVMCPSIEADVMPYPGELTWERYVENKNEWMNIKSKKEFKKWSKEILNEIS